MGGNCCSSEGPNSRKTKYEINTLNKLAQNNAKKTLLKKKRNGLQGAEYHDLDDEKISPSPTPNNPELEFNVIDLQYIDKSKRRSSSSLDIDIFTSIHDSDHEDEKKNEDECKSITECQYIKRLIIALKYYHKKQKKSKITDIIEFCEHTYCELINDYHHILFHHENNIEQLCHSLFAEYDISLCNIYKCQFVQRNQRDRLQKQRFDSSDDDKNNVDGNILDSFWIDFLDSIHCYLLHIYDYGYRIKINKSHENDIIKQTSYTSLDVKDDYCIDIPFVVLKENILSQRTELKNIGGFNRIKTHKYNLCVSVNDENKNRNRSMRLMPMSSSTNKKIVRTDFDCGLKYYYWSYYKNKQEYVEGKYRDIKEEIMNNNICKLNKYQYEIVITKANKMMNTKYIKSLKTDVNKASENHYENDDDISLENIVSVILYVDYEKLSQELKKTFSAKRSNEQMFSIMNRHMEFRNWSKVLRETINLYGMNINSLTSGKYYVGSKYVVASSLSIRFRAPTSMSKYLEIATRFVNNIDNGIILELSGNNQNDIKGFKCNFLSYFSGEDEILFMGTKWKLKLCTVRILKNNTNFRNYFKAFYYFDLMLSGTKISSIEAKKITKYDYKFLNSLITKEISGLSENKSMPPTKKDLTDESSKYLHEMFHSLCMDKETIVIDLILVNHYYKKLSKLIIHESITNLVLFDYIGSLFKNCKKIAIYAAMDEHQIDLLNVLNEITKANCKQFGEIRIRCKHNSGGQSWLCNAWNTDLEFKFSQKLWKANFNIGKGTAFDDILILSYQKKRKLSRSATMARIKLKSKKLLLDV